MADTGTTSFASVAREYCAWAESSAIEAPERDAVVALRLLVALYAAALRLPSGEASERDLESNSDEAWKRIYDRFANLPVSNYWELLNPLGSSAEEPVLASLADDLADIHRDLQRGLILFDLGEAEAAAWEWSFHFRVHWGHHLTAALYALHAWCADNQLHRIGQLDRPDPAQ